MTDDEIVDTYRCDYCRAPRGMPCVTPALEVVPLHACRKALAGAEAPPTTAKTPPPPVVTRREGVEDELLSLDYYPSCRQPLDRPRYGADPDLIRRPEDAGLSFHLVDGPDEHRAWCEAVAEARRRMGLPA
ncbi:MAG: hypothetical protein JSV86_05570 [Gemmatimonadota bacterium]|nr:MAG: hypothetical protein JSV86_05570 [Gemmatimonadota bacterium]